MATSHGTDMGDEPRAAGTREAAGMQPGAVLGAFDPSGSLTAACLDALPFYALLVDADHRILFANRATQRDLGRTPGELLGTHCPTVVHGVTQFAGCPLDEAVRAGTDAPVEREVRDERTGCWLSSNIYPTPLRTATGRPVYLHFVRDVSREKRIEQTAERELEAQAVLADVLRLALADTTLEQVLDAVLARLFAIAWLRVESRGAIFLSEGDPPVLVLKAQRELPAWTRERCRRVPFGACLCGRAAAAGRIEFACDVDERHEHGEGPLPPHGHYCVPIVSHGRVLGVITLYLGAGHERAPREEAFLGAVADALAGIVERRRAEEERGRLGAAVEQSTEALIITDEAGVIAYVNSGFEKMTGYSRADVVGAPLWCPACGFDQELGRRFWEAAWAAAQREGAWHGRLVGPRKDGVPRHFDATLALVRDAAGRVTGAIVHSRDCTKEVQLESQLRQSQKMEAMGQLAAGVAHEFKNALFVIKGYTELAELRTGAEDTPPSWVRSIGEVVARSLTLTRQLLAFSRQDEARRETLDVNAIIRDMAGMLPRLIGPHLELGTALAPDLGAVSADRGHLEQVLVNLVVNARDAMPGGGALRIATGEVALGGPGAAADCHDLSPGRYVFITVSDTGVGMSPAVQGRLFEPFFTTKETGQGTGLGLSTVYGIVKQTGGCIHVRSAPGAGSTFTVYLPRA